MDNLNDNHFEDGNVDDNENYDDDDDNYDDDIVVESHLSIHSWIVSSL